MMSNSAGIIGNNIDLCAEILIRLPTKSLIKFKCVSKQWLSLISNPNFCFSHTRQHQRNGFLEPSALLLRVEGIVSSEFDLVPLKHYSNVPFFDYLDVPDLILRQSCNGLLLCEGLDDEIGKVSSFFLCNPTTKKFKRLSFPRPPLKNCEFFVNLAFDPLKSPDYKVICIREVAENSNVLEMDIYSSSTDSWAVSRPFAFEVDAEFYVFEEVVFCNGMIHWNSYTNESACFDVENESLVKIPMPTPRNGELETYRYFGESRGTLYLAVTYHKFISLELDVHEMASDYSCWFWKHRLNLGDAARIFPELSLGCRDFCNGFSGVCFLRSEKEEKCKVVVWADGKIICYDFNDGAWKMVYDPGPGVKIGSDAGLDYEHFHEQRFLAHKYFENLSCI